MSATVALALWVVFGVVGFGWRSWLQRRRTGSTGFRGMHGLVGSVVWVAGVGFVVGLAVTIGAFVLLVAIIEVQMRRIEGPYLLRRHGNSYRDYLATVGRFVTRVGLVR